MMVQVIQLDNYENFAANPTTLLSNVPFYFGSPDCIPADVTVTNVYVGAGDC